MSEWDGDDRRQTEVEPSALGTITITWAFLFKIPQTLF